MPSWQRCAARRAGNPLYTQDYYTYVQSGYLKDLTSETILKNYMIQRLKRCGGRG